jgi:hypothetical protein
MLKHEKEKLQQVVIEVQEFLSEHELDGSVTFDSGPSVIVYLNKSNKCFSSEKLDSFNSSTIFVSADGMATHFMSNYTTLNDMALQLDMIQAMSDSICSQVGLCENRIYLLGDNIVFEFYPNIDTDDNVFDGGGDDSDEGETYSY